MSTNPTIAINDKSLCTKNNDSPPSLFEGLTGESALQAAWESLREEIAHYLDKKDINAVLNAAVFGARAHEGQFRQSGEPYFTHSLAVTRILAGQRFDLPVLQAGLLHDVLEDTPITKGEMTAKFGADVSNLVDGVSKLTRLKDQAPQEAQAESLKKMLVATTDDPRVIIIKLADRLHNMQTLSALRPDKRVRKARETLEIYVSIAGRLGLFYFRVLLEELAFSHLYPWRYAVLQKHYAARCQYGDIANKVQRDLAPLMREMGIKASITPRRRNLWDIYQRMERKQSFNEACRTVPLRVITTSEDDCYRILGLLHGRYRPISGKFEDYIAAPKSNGYRSLHTSVLMARKDVLNVQVRTRDMHNLAESGIIAIWHQYAKARSSAVKKHSLETERYMRDWLLSLGEMQYITHNPLEYYDAIKKELSPGDIHVYTPQGKVIDLPFGATPVDFAYAIHTEIGNRCVGARVNGRDYPIYQALKTSQTVEIITDDNANPQISWLQFVVTARARAGIKHGITMFKEQDIQTRGEQLLRTALRDFGAKFSQQKFDVFIKNNQCSKESLFIDIARGDRQVESVASAMLGQEVSVQKTLYIHTALDSGINLSHCCYPIPKDNIVGHIDTGVGIYVHRKDCEQAVIDDSKYCVCVRWADKVEGMFTTVIALSILDRPRMLSAVIDVISESGSNIVDIKLTPSSRNNKWRVVRCWLDVQDSKHLARIMRGIKMIEGVKSVNRTSV